MDEQMHTDAFGDRMPQDHHRQEDPAEGPDFETGVGAGGGALGDPARETPPLDDPMPGAEGDERDEDLDDPDGDEEMDDMDEEAPADGARQAAGLDAERLM